MSQIKQELELHGADCLYSNNKLAVSTAHKKITFFISGEHFDFEKHAGTLVIPEDQLIRQPEILSGIFLSRLNLNRKIFARQCELRKIDRSVSEAFLNNWHLMGATQSAFNLGLYFKDKLVCVASFSKGRKMDRLPEDQRSFELIRFCTMPGVTVTGGLTKLIRHFCKEKQAGDLMTYVDRQLSDGASFLKAGFEKYGETAPNYFLINRSNFERTAVKSKDVSFDHKLFYLTQNLGNIKLVYTPFEKL